MSLCITSQTHVYNVQPCDRSGDCKNPDRVRMGPITLLTPSFGPTALFPSPRKQCLVLKRFVFRGYKWMDVDKKREKIGEKPKKNQRTVRIKMLNDSDVLTNASEEEEVSEERQKMRGVGFKTRKVTQFHGVVSWCSKSSAVNRSNSAPCTFNCNMCCIYPKV